jgi:hypothetical protein
VKKTAVKLGQAELKINFKSMFGEHPDELTSSNLKPEFITLMELSHRTMKSVKTKMFAIAGRAGSMKNVLNNLN